MATLTDRLKRALTRAGLPPKDFRLPMFTEEQVKALEGLYPVRLMGPHEDVDTYRHHCGAAALVQLIKANSEVRERVPEGDGDDDDELTEEAVSRHLREEYGLRG